MCTTCVAQSTPMVAAGLVLLRRRALVAWCRAVLARRRPSVPADGVGRAD